MNEDARITLREEDLTMNGWERIIVEGFDLPADIIEVELQCHIKAAYSQEFIDEIDELEGGE